jgi:hypothetical protein
LELLLEALELFGIGIKKVPVFMPGKYSVTEKMSNPLNPKNESGMFQEGKSHFFCIFH